MPRATTKAPSLADGPTLASTREYWILHLRTRARASGRSAPTCVPSIGSTPSRSSGAASECGAGVVAWWVAAVYPDSVVLPAPSGSAVLCLEIDEGTEHGPKIRDKLPRYADALRGRPRWYVIMRRVAHWNGARLPLAEPLFA